MRNLLLAVLAIFVFSACDPGIKTFKVTPVQLPCPGTVKIEWEGDVDGGSIIADQPVAPALPDSVLKKGTMMRTVSTKTVFTYFFPSAAERHQTMNVVKPSCNPPKMGCGPMSLLFSGQCTVSTMGPAYNINNVSAADESGMLTQIASSADFPIHVQLNGNDIAVGAGGVVNLPPPTTQAAGQYTIYVPGQVGMTICAGAGPSGGGTIDAPQVQLTITGSCPP
jgi:hypothetical protein